MNLQDAQQEIKSYFNDYEVNTDKFDVENFIEYCTENFPSLDQDAIVTLCCNLEDTDTMNEIAHGNYESFDPWDEAQFNDGYWDISHYLNLYGEQEDEE